MTRVEKAQRLVDEGGVHIVFRSEGVVEGRVGRNEEGRAYHTFVYPDGTAACNCNPTYLRTDDLCAHALAVRLAMERSKP